MPGFDRSGPMGEGSMTGGGRGRCNPRGSFNARGVSGMGRGLRQGSSQGFGLGRRYGRGLGRRGGYPEGETWPGSSMDELNMLRDEADALKDELSAISTRIEELEGRKPEQT